MIEFSVIQRAKNGDEDAILQILNFYMKSIKKYSIDEDYIQMATLRILKGIKNFKNKKR